MDLKYEVLKDLSDKSVNGFYNAFHNTSRSSREFEWEFSDNPFGRAVYIQAKDIDGKIIGAISAIPVEFTSNTGERFLTGKPEDTMVDIFARLKHRKSDILKEMYQLLETECKKLGMEYFWGFTYASKPFIRLGFQSEFNSLQGILVIKPWNAYKFLSSLNPNNKLKQKLQIMFLSFGSFLLGQIKTFIRRKLNEEIIYDSKLNDKSLLLSHLSKAGKAYCINQTEEYLNWRIRDNPNSPEYHTVSLIRKGERIVEIIYSIRAGTAYIEQILYGETENTTVTRFIIHILQVFIEKNISVVRFMGFNRNTLNRQELGLLRKAGFLFVNRGIPFVFKKIGDKNIDMNPESVFLSRLFTQGNI